MRRAFRSLTIVSREVYVRRVVKLEYEARPNHVGRSLSATVWYLNTGDTLRRIVSGTTFRFAHSIGDSDKSNCNTDLEHQPAIDFHNILKNQRESSIEEIERLLSRCKLVLTDELILDALNRNRSDWKSAYIIFFLLFRLGFGSIGANVWCEILDILGRMRRFDEMIEVFVEMSQREGLLMERTYDILLRRFAAAHRVDEAINVYKRRKEFGIENDGEAFQVLLKWLCRYKHVELAEGLFVSRRSEFGSDIKTMNIILNGWCVLGKVYEAERFWKDILESKTQPDSFTYGTFINALTKKGKLGKAMKLLRAMWDNARDPDIVICNNAIDALCFKKRVPEALALYKEMCDKGYSPNASSYSSLIKHFCRIRRMNEAYKILDAMEQKGGDCMPSCRTYAYLLKACRSPEEVDSVMERMKKNSIKMTPDLFNLIFKLYMVWNYLDKARILWAEMERSSLGPDQRTYTIMIHELYIKGRAKEALCYYDEMVSKGMLPEPRTQILVGKMKSEPEKIVIDAKGKTGQGKKDKGHRSNHVRSKKRMNQRAKPGGPDSDISEVDMQ